MAAAAATAAQHDVAVKVARLEALLRGCVAQGNRLKIEKQAYQECFEETRELLHASRRDTRTAKAEAEEASLRLRELGEAMGARDATISALLADNKSLSQELATARAIAAWQRQLLTDGGARREELAATANHLAAQLGAASAELAVIKGRQAEAAERDDRVKVLLASARSEAGFKASLLGEANRQQAALRDELAALNARLAAAEGAAVASEARSSEAAARIQSVTALATEAEARVEARASAFAAGARRFEELLQESEARARASEGRARESEARCAGLTARAEELEGQARAFERRWAESGARMEGLSARLHACDARTAGHLAHAEELARELASAQVRLEGIQAAHAADTARLGARLAGMAERVAAAERRRKSNEGEIKKLKTDAAHAAQREARQCFERAALRSDAAFLKRTLHDCRRRLAARERAEEEAKTVGPAPFIPRLPIITEAQRAPPQLDAALLEALLPAALPIPEPASKQPKKGLLGKIQRAAKALPGRRKPRRSSGSNGSAGTDTSPADDGVTPETAAPGPRDSSSDSGGGAARLCGLPIWLLQRRCGRRVSPTLQH